MRSLAVLLFVPSALGAYFRYNGDLECDNAISNIDVQAHCDGADPSEDNNSCSLYEDVTFTGMFSVSNKLPESICLDIKFCYFGWEYSAFCTEYQTSMETCSDVDMYPLGDQYTECPYAGQYGFTSSFVIPESIDEVDQWNEKWGFGGTSNRLASYTSLFLFSDPLTRLLSF